MKTFPAGLDTILAQGPDNYNFVDLYDFTLFDGTTHLRYTNGDVDINYNGNIFTSKGPYFEEVSSRARGHWKIGLDPDTWEVRIAPTTVDPITGTAYPATIYGQPWLLAVRAGALDGASIAIHRGYIASWPQPWISPVPASDTVAANTLLILKNLFAGRVATIDCGRTGAVIKFNSWLDVFQRPMPHNLYDTSCRWTLFDAGCTLSRGSFSASGTVVSVTDDANFTTNLTSQATDYFTLGMITWVTGQNTPYSKSIVKYTAGPTGGIQLRAPMLFAINSGDTFTAYAGCDKSMNTCNNTFNNLANFGGFPFIPPPETGTGT